MPISKNALLRYAVIDACLRRKAHRWTFEKLRREVSTVVGEQSGEGGDISIRTLREDLKNMRSGGATGYDAPIAWDAENGYHYSEEEYSIFNNPLTIDDLVVLQQALGALEQLQGLGISKELHGVVQRLEMRLSYQDGLNERVILQFEQPANVQGQQWLGQLYTSIKNRQALWLTYRPFHAPEARREVVHLHLLKQYNGRWFVIGQRHGRLPGASVFALDRIQGVAPSEERYQQSEDDPTTFFANLIGVSVLPRAALLDIKLRFSAGRLPYVLTKPLHSSQQVDITEGEEIVRLKVVPTRELITLLLGYGADVEVVEPIELRNQIQLELARALENYHLTTR
jgi:predicted DNA-binding transcriptional regulator YafY